MTTAVDAWSASAQEAATIKIIDIVLCQSSDFLRPEFNFNAAVVPLCPLQENT